MINPHTQAALARERRDRLLAEAEAARRAGPGRPVVLRDGSAVLIRPVHRAGAELVRREPGAVEYELTLTPGGDPPPGRRAQPPVACPAPG